MIQRSAARRFALGLALVAVLMLGCGGPKEADVSEGASGEDSPAHDPSQPFALGDTGTVAVTNDQAYEIQVQREDGGLLFVMALKKNAVVDPNVNFGVRTYEAEVPGELASKYVAVGPYAFEMHAVDDTGYGFALRPVLRIYPTEDEIEAAREAGAALDPLKGNLVVLYKEQRSPQWVPQTSVSVDEDTGVVTVDNVAGAGAWRLAAKVAE